MASNPLAVMNLMAQAAQAKAQQPAPSGPPLAKGPKKPAARKVAAEKEQEKAMGKKPVLPKRPMTMPPQGGNGAPPVGGMPPQGM